MIQINALAGAPGEMLQPAVVLNKAPLAILHKTTPDPEAEITRFEAVRKEYMQHLQQIYQQTLAALGQESADIFQAYHTIAEDDFFFKKPIQLVREQQVTMDFAIEQEKNRVCEKFARMDDPYMKERASDIRNVCDALIRRLLGIEEATVTAHAHPFILVAEDLTPEDTMRINKRFLAGFVTEKGGITSHTVILAKTLGIPAVVGAAAVTAQVATGQPLYVNGDEGYCIIGPNEAFEQQYTARRRIIEEEQQLFSKAACQPATTADGHTVRVCVNTGDADSLATFDACACDGIGLFRTEFLFMGQADYPDEEAQFSAYRQIAEAANGNEVIIRTLDIGGDKQLAYMDLPVEDNPFLGYRAIRLCLDRPQIFLTQLKAILRASAYGHVKIMFPMVVTAEELQQAKTILQQAKDELRSQNLPFNDDIPVGVMIETPAAVLISDILAKQVDFFSIGTNDLIQYTAVTDRMNERVQYLYSSFNLSVLRAIQMVIDAAHTAGIPVGMCGEMASDILMVPLLLGMGLDEFSVAPTQAGRIKHTISQLHMPPLRQLVKNVAACQTTSEVAKCLQDFYEQTATSKK